MKEKEVTPEVIHNTTISTIKANNILYKPVESPNTDILKSCET